MFNGVTAAMRYLFATSLAFFGLTLTAWAEDNPRVRNDRWLESAITGSKQVEASPRYRWQTADVHGNAQLLTLFCRNCFGVEREEVPVVSILRDTAGDSAPENDRVSYVWLLSVPHLNAGQRILSAIPFFYWRVGRGSDNLSEHDLKPQMNLTAPQDPMMSGAARQIVQWMAFDPLAAWVRAPSRSYQANATDNIRFHLEETISYLRTAPVSNSPDTLTGAQLNTLVARLELRKRLTGGLVDGVHAERFGGEVGFEEERVRSRNWEVLRQCAEKTGLYFEPVNLGDADGRYGILWFPTEDAQPPNPESVKLIWKVLSISDPWQDPRLKQWEGLSYERALDGSGRLLPRGSSGPRTVRMVPLAFYSLMYPRVPLLLADFRDRMHIRRHEMTQRSITQVTSGVIGISRLTNWYYYAGVIVYNFVAGRHGSAVNQALRLDCYAQFRVHLSADMSLDGRLRSELEARARSLTVSPLDSTGEHGAKLARARYSMLLAQTAGQSELAERLERDRRAEIANFGQTTKAKIGHSMLHFASVGLYTQRASKEQLSLAELDRERRFIYTLNYLSNTVKNGTQPEVTYSSADIAASVSDLNRLSVGILSVSLRTRAVQTLQKIADLTKNRTILADCRQAMAVIQVKPIPSAEMDPSIARRSLRVPESRTARPPAEVSADAFTASFK